MDRIKVLLVDDHEVVRKGLASVLEQNPDFEVVGETGSREEAVKKATALKPDVIVLDLKLGEDNGAHICQVLKEAHPESKVLILSAFVEEEGVFDAFNAGANGYILKDANAPRILEQIKAVYRGEEALDRRVLSIIMKKFRSTSRRETRGIPLKEQEISIVKFVADGYTNKQIANTMYLSDNTIKRHLQDIMNKLGVNNRAELVNRAIRMNII